MSPSPRPVSSRDVEEQEDNWDKAVNSSGCARENEALLNCKSETGDWRRCTAEMMAFKECFKQKSAKVSS